MRSSGSLRSSAASSAANPRPLVSIIIVTINTPELTRACLQSVERQTTVPHELIVVNNSRASAIRQCLAAFRRIRVIQHQENVGYAKAANQGVLAARGSYLCFLNTDTLVPPEWAQRLLTALQRPSVGAVGPVTGMGAGHDYGYPRVWPPPGLPVSEATVSLTDAALQRWFPNRTERVPWLSGFCLVLARATMRQVGLFDERFFFGWEDVDYSLRLRLWGYHLLRVQSLFVSHQWGGSVSPAIRRRLVRDTKRRFLAKWQGILNRRMAHPREVLEAFEGI